MLKFQIKAMTFRVCFSKCKILIYIQFGLNNVLFAFLHNIAYNQYIQNTTSENDTKESSMILCKYVSLQFVVEKLSIIKKC